MQANLRHTRDRPPTGLVLDWARGEAEGGVKDSVTPVSTLPPLSQGPLGVGKTQLWACLSCPPSEPPSHI